jgi:toxin ParE1/3/4
MSAHNFSLIFSFRARQDVEDILSYTLENFGEKQLQEYKSILGKTFSLLQETPAIGKRLNQQRMVLPVGQHSIFYRIDKDTIYIIRILHRRMDIYRHL